MSKKALVVVSPPPCSLASMHLLSSSQILEGQLWLMLAIF